MNHSFFPRAALLTGVLLIGSAGIVPFAFTLEDDASAPIEISADRLELDDKAGTAVYTGDVDMQQGSMKLTGARIEIQRNAEGQVSQVTATGDRAYIEQKPSPEDPLAKGWGQTIVYHATERRIELIDNAELHRGEDVFNGAFVEYQLDRRIVEARSDAKGSTQRQRVRMTLTPAQ